MPLCEVKLNFPVVKQASIELAKALSKGVVTALGKPEAYMQVYVQSDVPLTFGGTDSPAALVQVSSIGGISSDQNKKTASFVTQTLKAQFSDLSGDRVYVLFADIAGANWAQNGKTFG
ncbi:Tautomerase/MIF [Gonapodya prolifera JEL478]|uniref:L-dopachrome isomerase n=1 Tax=Gonapodya prolifera (strain JEL478) TaxID=1344416 RepID=A0A139A079_GONPJ|nr:Tautomerase/MIF [Gonapodya prolifera JEL478]|eukprot:KXS09945.1 Tautomerase/MIF [Gonapodya prolifera JEL478]